MASIRPAEKRRIKGVRRGLFTDTSLLGRQPVAHADISGKVVAVPDGDTIKVLDSRNRQHKVHLLGIDAAEKPQPFGNASRKHLASLVAGKEVRVESSKKDRYGRLLGKVWVQPGDCPGCGKTLDVNLAQIPAQFPPGSGAGGRLWLRTRWLPRSPRCPQSRILHRDRLQGRRICRWRRPANRPPR